MLVRSNVLARGPPGRKAGRRSASTSWATSGHHRVGPHGPAPGICVRRPSRDRPPSHRRRGRAGAPRAVPRTGRPREGGGAGDVLAGRHDTGRVQHVRQCVLDSPEALHQMALSRAVCSKHTLCFLEAVELSSCEHNSGRGPSRRARPPAPSSLISAVPNVALRTARRQRRRGTHAFDPRSGRFWPGRPAPASVRSQPTRSSPIQFQTGKILSDNSTHGGEASPASASCSARSLHVPFAPRSGLNLTTHRLLGHSATVADQHGVVPGSCD
jgi:hypothetical protein